MMMVMTMVIIVMVMPAVRRSHVRLIMSESLVPCLDRLEAPFTAVAEKLVGSVTTALR